MIVSILVELDREIVMQDTLLVLVELRTAGENQKLGEYRIGKSRNIDRQALIDRILPLLSEGRTVQLKKINTR